MTYPIKMCLIARDDLMLSAGKVASQMAHVAVRCALKAKDEEPELFKKYLQAEVKYVLRCKDLEHLYLLAAKTAKLELIHYVFVDQGPTTEGTEGEITALGIFGPTEIIDKVTGRLVLY